MADDWQSQVFRDNIILIIHDFLPFNTHDPMKNSIIMEHYMFQKSRTKDEYLSLVAKLFMHYNDMKRRAEQRQREQQDQHQQGGGGVQPTTRPSGG